MYMISSSPEIGGMDGWIWEGMSGYFYPVPHPLQVSEHAGLGRAHGRLLHVKLALRESAPETHWWYVPH